MSKPANKVILVPGATGWEIWTGQPESGFTLHEASTMVHAGELAGLPPGEVTLLFPVASITSIPLRVTTEDEEAGTADVLLALPVSRTSVILTRLGSALTAVGVMAVAFVASLVTGTAILDFSIAVDRYLASGLVLAALGWLLACIATLLGSLTGRRGASLGVSMGAAVAAFVLYSLAPLVEVLDSILFLNPLQWTLGSSPLTDGVHWGYVTMTAGLAAVAAAVAVVVYGRRDIPG